MTQRLDDPDRRDDVQLDAAETRRSALGAYVRGQRVDFDSVESGVRALRVWIDEHPMAWRQVVQLAGDGAERLTRAEILERAARHLTLDRRRLWFTAVEARQYVLPAATTGEDVEGELGEPERIWASFEMDAEPNDLDAEIEGEYEAEEIDAAVDGDWEAEEIDAATAGEWEAEEIDAGTAGEWEAEEIDTGAAGEWKGVEREDELEAAQAGTLREAAEHGTPFCAECERLRAAQATGEDERVEAA